MKFEKYLEPQIFILKHLTERKEKKQFTVYILSNGAIFPARKINFRLLLYGCVIKHKFTLSLNFYFILCFDVIIYC